MMRDRTIFVLTELYHPEETSTGHFLTGIAEELGREFPVRVICSQPTYSQRGLTAPWSETRNGVEIERCRGTRLDKNRLLPRTVNAVTITVALVARLLRRVRQGDAILVVTNPPLLPFGAAVVAAVRGAVPILLVHDVYPDAMVAGGLVSERSPVVRIWRRLARRTLGRFVKIVVLGRDMRDLVAQRYAVEPHRLEIIPNWGEVDDLRPIAPESSRFRASNGLESSFVVEYTGNIGRTHCIEDLLESAKLLRDDPDTRLVFVGWGSRAEWLAREASGRRLDSVQVHPRVPWEDLSDTLGAADLAVVTLKSGMVGVSVPSRVYNLMAAGRPLLTVADEGAEVALLTRELDIGWVVPPGHPDRLADVIREARSEPVRLAEMGRRARSAAESRFSRPRVGDAYRRLFRDLVAEASES
jgi:glycosyltransferase involved in cell wall biosynthesis